MPVRTAEAEWRGSLADGDGSMRMRSGAYEGSYSAGSRFQEDPGTNPEELIAAAHAGCFSMALSGALGKAGHPPKSIRTTARVTIAKVGAGFEITGIELDTEGDVPGIDEEAFREAAEGAKENCPVSKALRATPIRVAGARLAAS